MDYKIITNNNKVFNFFKETDEVIFLEDYKIEDILKFIESKCLEGHRLLSDPILYNLENLDNPFKSILITNNQLEDNSHSIKIILGVLDLITKVSFTPKESLDEISLEEFRFVDLNLIRDSIDKINFM
ncbi:GrdX family protein [Cetobacterium sp. 8H]|uniref:GrdX family protein n=1 Tax=Cetobacterium sp. 8H TaxID=2759681 RepID=UPI00163CAB27|nr:GrdX family protein [Cetobacterium sp. 8H]MBC2851475.1 GrdX family protein [Cetobacterium sp. 8H]